MDDKYDVIVAGASFAGLATATAINGKVLLIDRKTVGALPVSACGTVRSVPESLGLSDTILSDIKALTLHVGERAYRFGLEPSWCTFDYKGFSEGMFARYKGEFLKANIRGVTGSIVQTDRGDFEAKCIVDCTGWRSKLSTDNKKDILAGNLGFAIEAVADMQSDQFHFLHDDRIIKKGIAWIFPAGRKSRIGVGSYVGDQGIKENLLRFLEGMNVVPQSFHGGIIPWRLREPVCENIFIVGDAAGMVFAVFGEGIRQSIFFGRACAQYIQNVIEDRTDLQEALKRYRSFVISNKRWFDFFANRQDWVTNASEGKLRAVAGTVSARPFAHIMQKRFGKLYRLDG